MLRAFGLFAVSTAAFSSLSPPLSRRQRPVSSSVSASRPGDQFDRRDEQPPSSSRDLPGSPLDASDLRARYANLTSAMPRTEADAPLHDAEVPRARRRRWEREARVRARFASGDALCELRATAARLRRELVALRTTQPAGADERLVGELEEELLRLNGRDAEFMYAVSSELAARAQAAGHDELAGKYQTQAEDARSCIPQMNMHGLWVGK